MNPYQALIDEKNLGWPFREFCLGHIRGLHGYTIPLKWGFLAAIKIHSDANLDGMQLLDFSQRMRLQLTISSVRIDGSINSINIMVVLHKNPHKTHMPVEITRKVS